MVRWHLRGRDIVDERVIRAMLEVPRERFVPAEMVGQAYSDGPLPIGFDQTISQPYIVALMSQELQVCEDCEVLEIGTGSGYQTAILAKLTKKVYTIERFEQLSRRAQQVLAELGITNVEYHIGDGSCGWPQPRQFDRIMITAAVPQVPEPLRQQLADGGILIAPVGGGRAQSLMVYCKQGETWSERFVCDVRFVRLVGDFGFPE